jgi:D-xylose transport system substrate-binding protein
MQRKEEHQMSEASRTGQDPPARKTTRRQFISQAGVGIAGASLFTKSAFGGLARKAATKKIGFAMATFAVVRYTAFDFPIFKKTVSSLGYTPVVNEADDDPAKQVSNVEDLLTLGVDALVLQPVISDAAVSLVQKAKEANVPVLVYNTPIPSADVKGFVARDNIAMGKLIANAALKDTGLKGNWIVIGGDKGNGVADLTVVGFHQVVDPYVKNGTMKLVAEYNEKGFDPDIARTQTEEALTKTNDQLRGVLGMWDDGAIGSLAAINARKLGGKVWLGGQDASEPALRAMVLGQFNTSGFTQFDVMATTAAQLAVKLAKGQSISSPQTYDTGAGKVPFFPVKIYPVSRANMVVFMKKYPSYADPTHILFGIPRSKWPKGAAALVGKA